MFENVLGQPIVRLLHDEIQNKALPPSILFSGPEASGKLTAALEAARVLSCMETGAWTCSCESCRRQKELAASDLLILGTRDTILETKAAAKSFCEAKTLPARYLFTRSVRKLTARFDSRLWDTDESRFLKAAPLLADIDEQLSDLIDFAIEALSDTLKKELEKRTAKIVDLCEKLQEDCLYDSIPVNQVRKASAWVRLMPTGKKKVLIIENADKMQESARNAFLKILEEPPDYAVFILTTTRRAAIIPTILSRVRTYAFIERPDSYQQAVIERVFRDPHFCKEASGRPIRIVSYLHSFLPVGQEDFREAAALFWEYCFNRMKQTGKPYLPVLFETVAAYRNIHNAQVNAGIADILKLLNNCKPHKIYTLFLEALIAFLQESIRHGDNTALELEHYAAISRYVLNAVQSSEIFNSTPQAALETLVEEILLL